MEAMKQSWSDDRLDGLNIRVESGFARVDERFAQVDERFAQVDERFAQVDKRFDRLEKRIDDVATRLDSKIDASSAELRNEMQLGFHQLNCRFDAMQQTMIRFGGGLIGVLVASSAGLIATQL